MVSPSGSRARPNRADDPLMAEGDLFPQRHNRVAVAVVHGDVPQVFLAENVDVLGRLLALHLVARTPAEKVTGWTDRIRQALLDERWGDAVLEWMSATDNVVDGYDDEHVWTEERLERDFADFELRLSPLFRDPPA